MSEIRGGFIKWKFGKETRKQELNAELTTLENCFWGMIVRDIIYRTRKKTENIYYEILIITQNRAREEAENPGGLYNSLPLNLFFKGGFIMGLFKYKSKEGIKN